MEGETDGGRLIRSVRIRTGRGICPCVWCAGTAIAEFEVTEVGRYKREAKAVLGAVNRALDAHVGHGLGREMCQGGRWMGLGFGVTPECAADLRAALALPEQGVLL